MQQAIDIVVSAASEDVVDLTKQQQETVQGNQVKKWSVIQATYVLNDTAALKKKGRNETNRKEAFNTGALCLIFFELSLQLCAGWCVRICMLMG